MRILLSKPALYSRKEITMTKQTTKYPKIIQMLLVILFFGLPLATPTTTLALEKMSDNQLEDIYARNASDAQIATGPTSDALFHYNNAIQPISQTAGDIQTYLGAASTIGQFAGPPQEAQRAVNDAQTVASGTTLGLGGI